MSDNQQGAKYNIASISILHCILKASDSLKSPCVYFAVFSYPAENFWHLSFWQFDHLEVKGEWKFSRYGSSRQSSLLQIPTQICIFKLYPQLITFCIIHNMYTSCWLCVSLLGYLFITYVLYFCICLFVSDWSAVSSRERCWPR